MHLVKGGVSLGGRVLSRSAPTLTHLRPYSSGPTFDPPDLPAPTRPEPVVVQPKFQSIPKIQPIPTIKPVEYYRRDTDVFDQVDKYGTRKAAFNKEGDYEPPGQQKGKQSEELASKSTPLRQVRGKTTDKEESNYISVSELDPGERSPSMYGTHQLKFTQVKLPHSKLMQELTKSKDDIAGDPATLTKGGPWIPSQQSDPLYAKIAKERGIPTDQTITESQRAQLYSAHDREALAEGTQGYGTQVQLLKHTPLPTDRDKLDQMLRRSGSQIPEHLDPGSGGKVDWTKLAAKRSAEDPHSIDSDAYYTPLSKEETVHLGELTRSKGAYKPTNPEMRKILETYGSAGPKDRVRIDEVEGVLNTKHVSPDHEKALEKEASMLERREKGISVSQMPEKGHYQQRGVVSEIDEVNGTMYMNIGRNHEVAVPLSAIDKVPKVNSEVSLNIQDGKGTATPVVQQHDRGHSVGL